MYAKAGRNCVSYVKFSSSSKAHLKIRQTVFEYSCHSLKATAMARLLPQKVRHKADDESAKEDVEQVTPLQAGGVAAILAVAGAVLHEDVVAAGAHQAEAFVALNARLAHVGAAPEVTPLPVHLLADLAAHRGSDTLQMLQFAGLLAIRNR